MRKPLEFREVFLDNGEIGWEVSYAPEGFSPIGARNAHDLTTATNSLMKFLEGYRNVLSFNEADGTISIRGRQILLELEADFPLDTRPRIH